MHIRKYVIFPITMLALTACISDQNPKPLDPKMAEFINEYNKSRGITKETHGAPEELALFSKADVPQTLPHRESRFSGSGMSFLVKHSLGYSEVAPLYELNVNKRYSKSGRGPAVPVFVRIEPQIPSNANASFPRSSFRRVVADKKYQFSRPIYSKVNREVAIQLAREVLSKTHCTGGTVTENHDNGEFASAYGRRAKSASGLSISPGWVVNFRCSRWRLK